ncbi:breast cancer type 1 susceptibility protein isoform X3 [Falco biarmicus]|uniref:breast cancer type 1 susceptibility protein isoform X3 n=1 Tax=Falco biarmicus TaxID=345155 RepID=UPI0024BCE9F7|nr:breast cancer type 1 susceptibility protein isoform X3 [Falco biarmicus]
MDFSAIAIGDVQNVLSAMWKNLECPICLDVVEEPVSTKCDHVFCRFCMFKLFSRKKKGVVQCPLCKTEVTKRSLRENARFKQLIEALLETIYAFELDTGVKFLNSHHVPKTSTEATATESLCKESSVIQSKVFRNRKRSAKENGQENCTLEANVDTQLTNTRVKGCPLRNKTQKRGSQKGIYIEFGSDSSEELFKQASNIGLEDKAALQTSSEEKLEELKNAEKGKEYSCNNQPDMLGAKEVILPNVVGEVDFSKENLSKKNTWSITENAKPGHVNMTEYQSSPSNVLALDLLAEQCDGIGQGSGYDSENSYVEDSCEPFSQGEILTTQEKNVMQSNLKKLQHEMAVLEAVLQQHGSQDCGFSPIHRELPHSSGKGILGMEQVQQGRGAESTSEGNFENHKGRSSEGLSANDLHDMPSDSLNNKTKELEKERSPELLLPSSKSRSLKRLHLEKGLQCDSMPKNKAHSEKTKPAQEAVQEYSHCQLEAENADEQKSGTRLNSSSVLSNLCGNVTRIPNNSSSSVRLLNPRTEEATISSVVAQKANKSCAQEHKLKRSVCLPLSALHNAAGKENTTSPGVTNRKEMSIVASGLNQSENLLVQKFARKTQSTLSNHITEGTTHVIIKTDQELVCERTLKYFLGIAGRKWVVSYQWVIQSFTEGRILNEEDFEVRGDVINGRNHQGPRRARQSLTEKIFKDFEICCYGPFIDMTTEHLEWMVELCGATVVKQPHLFSHTANSTAVVVVQPDAWMENTDYRAIQRKNNVAMVTREWVLDSVACYECQELDAYLVS